VDEILNGQNLMNCALCKYREQILGFEAEVGLPQESHHHHVEGILGGEEQTFSQGEKVPAKQADEGVPAVAADLDGRSPSPVAFGDTLSPRERVQASPSVLHYKPSHSHTHGHHPHDHDHDHGHDHHHPYPHADHPLGPRSLKRK